MSGVTLNDVVSRQRVVVCCGAGGVGKTSVSCAIALGAARRGRRVLAVTIDPSMRLAQALGVQRHSEAPTVIEPERLREVGVEPPGSLSAWMLDPKVVSDALVTRFSSSPEEAERLMDNRIYRQVTSMVAGMQEYTAVEAMYDFVRSDAYDLVVLDTPPSRNALHFLEAPSRVTRFLDGRVFRFFLPQSDGLVQRAAAKVTERVLEAVFGEENRQDLMAFFGLFSTILRRVSQDASHLQELFLRPDVSFLIVTSPAQEALEEAAYFEHKTREELKLPLHGYVLNRSLAAGPPKRFPDQSFFADKAICASAQEKLRALAEVERRQLEQHRSILARLRESMGSRGFAEAAAYLPDGVDDLATLQRLSEALLMGA